MMSKSHTIRAVFLILTITKYFTRLQACTYFTEVRIKENSRQSQNLLNITKELLEREHLSLKASKTSFYHLQDAVYSKPFSLQNDVLYLREPIDREYICKPSDETVQKIMADCCNKECCKFIGVVVQPSHTVHVIKVIIEDENDVAPVFNAGINGNLQITLEENQKVGTRINLPKAFDADSEKYSVKKYFIKNESPQFNSYIELKYNEDLDTGPYLILKKSIDREVIDNLFFTLTASDGNFTGSLKVHITILDVNDNAPQFEKAKYDFVIPEDQRRNIYLIPCKDSDIGSNGRISYTIKSQKDIVFNHFQINTVPKGVELEQIKSIDYETVESFNFHIEASDSGEPRRSSMVLINVQVTNKNDNKPSIRFYNFGMPLDEYNPRLNKPESIKKEDTICYVHVSDKDKDTRLDDLNCRVISPNSQFYLTEQPSNMQLQRKKVFRLSSNVNFDRESQANYRIIIHCEDGPDDEKQTTESILTINVDDINDNKPLFTRPLYYGFVSENMPNVEVNMDPANVIHATDKDEGNNAKIKYLIDTTSGDVDLLSRDLFPFVINPMTGQLRTTQMLDFEKKRNFTFNVIACDMGDPSLNSSVPVVINIIDENDNPPIVERNHYLFDIEEGLPPRSIVGQIVATDADFTPENKDVFYSLENTIHSVSSNYFSVDRQTGIITTKVKLDREIQHQHHFMIKVSNRNVNDRRMLGQHSKIMTAEVSVTVNVVDINDNVPVMRHRIHQQSIKQDIIFIVETFDKHNPCVDFPYEFYDKDQGKNAEIDVTLLPNEYFVLKMKYQMICSATSKLPPKGRYNLHVMAKDRGENSSLGNNFTISVLVRSDPSRKFEQPIRDDQYSVEMFASDSRNITIIAILVSLAGLFCLILLCIVITLRRCPQGYKDDQMNKDENLDSDQLSPERYLEAKMCQSKSCDGLSHILHETRNLMDEQGNQSENYHPTINEIAAFHRLGDHWMTATLSKGGSEQTEEGASFQTPDLQRKFNLDSGKSLSRSCEQLQKNLNFNDPDENQTSTYKRINFVNLTGDKFSSDYSKENNYQIIDPNYQPSNYTLPSAYVPSQNYYLKCDSKGQSTLPNNIHATHIIMQDDSHGSPQKKKTLKNVYFQTSFV